jgi:hypothetical protein
MLISKLLRRFITNRKILTICSSLIFIAALLLTACTSAPTTSTVSTSNNLPTATKLALGTLKLEGTNAAVTSTQATQLLTLWEGYQSLSDSDTSSQVELEALVKQMQGTMTTDQIKAIEAMNLADQSMSEIMGTLGGSNTASTPASTPSTLALNQGAPSGGQGGMPSDGGGITMGDITGGMTTQRTPAATQSTSSAGTTQVNPMLLKALIQMLKTRSQTTG